LPSAHDNSLVIVFFLVFLLVILVWTTTTSLPSSPLPSSLQSMFLLICNCFISARPVEQNGG
jgi:biotin transporter BioY